MKNKLVKRTLAYFFRGLALVAPIYFTLLIIWRGVSYLDGILPIYFPNSNGNPNATESPIYLPGLGLLIIVGGIVALGFVFSRYVPTSFMAFGENILKKVPLVSLIYYSIKDLITAFVGDKKKFNKPVLLTINKESGIKKLGFLTQKDLTNLSLASHVAVYCPHSYAFSGELFIAPSENVQPLDLPSADVMKMIVSGGVSLSA